jgi:hypothetical protein
MPTAALSLDDPATLTQSGRPGCVLFSKKTIEQLEAG